MRRLLMIALLAPGPAGAVDWHFEGLFGFGRPVGTGADVYDLGFVGAAGVGVRLLEPLVLSGRWHAHRMRLENTEDIDDADGWLVQFLVAPEVHFLGRRWAVRPYVAPVAGYGYQSLETAFGGAELEARARGWYVGGLLGVLYQMDALFAVSAELSYSYFLPGRSCVDAGDLVACEEDPADRRQGFLWGGAGLRITP